MKRTSKSRALRLRIALDEIDPPIWRELIFPRTASLHELHRTIQVLFGWYDYHLYEFVLDGTRFEMPHDESEGEDSTKAKLSKVIVDPSQVLEYIYDFGDSWLHRVEVLDMSVEADPGWIPYLVDGARRGPPEDCGGVSGYRQLIEALRTPYDDLDEDGRSFVDWAGDFDPEDYSVSQARHALLLSSAWGSLKRRT